MTNIDLTANSSAPRCYCGRVLTTQDDTSVATETPISLTDLGRVRVLRALAESTQLSRAEIASRTGLARATVASVVYDLISGGLVQIGRAHV